MYTQAYYKSIFDSHGGIMKTKELEKENIYYHKRQELMQKGLIEKVRYGYFRWVDTDDFSDVRTITHLYPDAIFCLETALHYYDYSNRTPRNWHLAVDKNSGKSRFKIDYPFIKPYYYEPSVLNIGVTSCNMDGQIVRIYNKDRLICDCLRYRNKMDREIFNRAIRSYVIDPEKNISSMLEYAQQLRVLKIAKDLIGVWL